ncbi:hypothetical protein WCT93_02570 [Pectobacterium atrosepticum]|jgi:hypothetical protein|uniref:hypothetical protein n=1 Tax=Pectobacterium atrosepticum TaxID=29471 RepID=UPI00301B05ED
MNEEKKLALGFIQDIISRLSQKSFLVKGWSLSIVAVLGIMLDKNKYNESLAFVICISIFIFWFLNSFYLHTERLYRCLYAEKILLKDEDTSMLSLDLSVIKNNKSLKKKSLFNAFFSKTVWPFHLIIFIGAISLLFFHK